MDVGGVAVDLLGVRSVLSDCCKIGVVCQWGVGNWGGGK